jgi:hypothetical protein
MSFAAVSTKASGPIQPGTSVQRSVTTVHSGATRTQSATVKQQFETCASAHRTTQAVCRQGACSPSCMKDTRPSLRVTIESVVAVKALIGPFPLCHCIPQPPLPLIVSNWDIREAPLAPPYTRIIYYDITSAYQPAFTELIHIREVLVSMNLTLPFGAY